MVKIIKRIALLIVLGFIMTMCSQKIVKYNTSPNGLVYKIFNVAKSPVKPVLGNWAYIDIKQVYKDSVIFDSKSKRGGQPICFKIMKPDFKGDWMEGICMMSPGDSSIFVVPVDSLFGAGQRPQRIDSNSSFYFHVKLISFDSLEGMREKEVENIQQCIKDNNITSEPTSEGVYIITELPGNGITIDTGCYVRYNLRITFIDGRPLFSKDSLELVFGARNNIPGFFLDGIKTLQKGGKVKFLVPSKLGLGEKGERDIPPYTPFIYQAEIVDVISKDEFAKKQEEQKLQEQMRTEMAKSEEAVLLEKYLKDNNINAQPTGDGLYYIETVAGTGPQAGPGKKVRVHYTGTLINGKKFDSSLDRNQPIEITLGQKQVIKGWEEGIALMKQGGKAKLIIPSALAYGETGAGRGVIPPYATIVFDVELIEVSESAPLPIAPENK